MASFDKAIPPGQAGKIQATVRTEGLRGPMSKSIAVTSNDPKLPTFNLTLKGTIVGSANLYPAPSAFINVGQTPENKVMILCQQDPTEQGTLQVSDVVSSEPWLSVSPRKVEKDEQVANVHVAAKPGDWIFEIKVIGESPKPQGVANVRFKTGLAREPEISIPVTIRIIPEIILSAPQLVLPSPGTPDASTQGFTFATVREGLDPAELKVEAAPASFHAALDLVSPQRFKVTVTWTPAGANTPREGTVTLSLGKAVSTLPVLVREGAIQPSPQQRRAGQEIK